jgi:PrcB C-terminal
MLKGSKNVLPGISILVVLAFGINACQERPQAPVATQVPQATQGSQTGQTVPFETLDWNNFSTGYIVYDSDEPGMMVFRKPEDVGKLQLNTPDDIEAQRKLEELDYSKYFALLVLEGAKPSTGYSVKITSIMRSGNVLTVYADFLEFPENMERAAVVTYPYYLVAIEKTGEWAETVTFNLVVDQAVVVSYP